MMPSIGVQTSSDSLNKLAIAWIDLQFSGQSVLFWKAPKIILNNINGSVSFGTLTALMGPSGCGKSTLLKCINGRNTTGLDSNSEIYLSADKKIRSCFIVQDISEHLLVGLTAMQTLVYASKLKNSQQNGAINHKMAARKLLTDLMIKDTEGTNVENCSGGEQKRIAIAIELMAVKKPNLLCIDEPTSGLDSNAAEIVVQVLKTVSRKHDIAVVTSIHQPNNDTLMLFDGVYVLAKGGLCVYSGPPHEIRSHLSEAQFECTEHQVPIEVLLRIASKYDTSLQRLVSQSLRAKSQLKHRCLVDGYLAPEGIINKTNKFDLRQMWELFGRTMLCQLRSQWKATLAQFIFLQILGWIATQIYNEHIGEPDGCFSLATNSDNNCLKTVEGLREEALLSQNLRFLFFSGLLLSTLMSIATVLLFASEIKVFMNERKNGWYSTGSYFMAKNVSEIPSFLLIVVCYFFIIYKTNNQISETKRMVGFLLVLIGECFCGQSLGFFVGIATNANFKLSVVLDIGVVIVSLFFSGFPAPIQELPDWLQFIANFSYIKQAFEMHLYLIYGFDRCPKGTVPSLLYQYNLVDEKKFWFNVPILLIHGLVLRGLAFLALYMRTNQITLRTLIKSVVKSEPKGKKTRVNSIDDNIYM